MLSSSSIQGEQDGWGIWHEWWRREMYKITVGKLERMRSLGRSRCGWEEVLKCFLKKKGGRTCTLLVWLRMGTDNELLGCTNLSEFLV
jgi:hypothetical protein